MRSPSLHVHLSNAPNGVSIAKGCIDLNTKMHLSSLYLYTFLFSLSKLHAKRSFLNVEQRKFENSLMEKLSSGVSNALRKEIGKLFPRKLCSQSQGSGSFMERTASRHRVFRVVSNVIQSGTSDNRVREIVRGG